MKLIPKLLLKQLYTRNSLENAPEGVRFSVKNRLKDGKLTGIECIKVNNVRVETKDIFIDLGNNLLLSASEITPNNPLDFPLKKSITLLAKIPKLDVGKHELKFIFQTIPFGKLEFHVEDAISDVVEYQFKIPRDKDDNYSEKAIDDRHAFVTKYTGASLPHIRKYSFDPHTTDGNCENFIGVAQIPLGIAGPLKIDGEHANGEFLIPMATTEGTLVASYNRGIKLLNACGGVKCTVIGDSMQRAPVFVFEDARAARDFVQWVRDNEREIAEQAEATSSVAKLQYIDSILANKFAYLRFNYYTGDAAGQNMVGRATFVACSWILEKYKNFEVKHFYLESNLATDKKASQINVMRTRGKRVVAEAIIKKDILLQQMRVDPKSLAYHGLVSNVGTILSGANNNGAHSANAITAIFIATGQDVANVSESSAAVLYTELTEEEDLYISITIPSLIVATYGGGTHLATQKEALEIMGCLGKGKVNKLAEIIAGVVLAGELSLGSAISASDWVSSHEEYGRNR